MVSRSIGALTRAYDATAPPGAPSLRQHASLLRFARAAPVTTNELPAHARLSSRTTKTAVASAERRGWVVVDQDPDQPRRRVIRFTDAGIDASDEAAGKRDAAEDEWLRHGGDADALRDAAEAVVGALDLELAHHPRRSPARSTPPGASATVRR